MPPPAAHDRHCLLLVLAPGTLPLSRVLSTARSRAIDVRGAVYAELAPGRASLRLDITADRPSAERAVLQLSRVVDVLSVRVAQREASAVLGTVSGADDEGPAG